MPDELVVVGQMEGLLDADGDELPLELLRHLREQPPARLDRRLLPTTYHKPIPKVIET